MISGYQGGARGNSGRVAWPSPIAKWIVAAPELEDELSGRVFRAKQVYGKLPEAELAALAAYLQNPDAASTK